MTYTATFTGREVGAIGKFHSIGATVTADNEEAARLRLYDRFEHISGLKLNAIETGQDYANLKAALLDLGRETYEKRRGELIARLGYDGFRDLQNKVFREIGTIKHEQSERRTFYFCTGVRPASLTNPPRGPLGEHETLDANGVLLIKFECEGVPQGASFAFACSNPSLHPGVYIVRPILSGGLLSEYAYFTKPVNQTRGKQQSNENN